MVSDAAAMKFSWQGLVLDGLENLKKLFAGEDDKEGFTLEDQQKVECIFEVVDHSCGRDSQRSVWLAGRVVQSLVFRSVIIMAIILDSLVVALETDITIEEQYGALLSGLSKFFLTLFVMEVLLKWYHDFLGYWTVSWNIFDFTVIFISFLLPSYLGRSPVMNSMRVLHAIRSLRFISALPGLQTVIRTVVYSIPGMFNVVLLLLIWMFSFAILGISWFGNNCSVHFGSLERAMFSLFVCITQDGWVDIKKELQSCGSPVLGDIYLIIFITIGAFILVNLVVAVVVTNLEWVIQQQTTDQHPKGSKPSEKPIGKIVACNVLLDMAQQPVNLEQKNLDKYFTLVAELEKRFSEFKKLKNTLTKIQQEVSALENLEEGYDGDIGDVTGTYFTKSFKKREHSKLKKSLHASQKTYSTSLRKISELVSGSSLPSRNST